MNKLILACFLILSMFALFTEIDNSLDIWIENNSDSELWLSFQDSFGSDDFIVIATKNKEEKISDDFVATLSKLEQQLRNVSYVRNIVSIVSIWDKTNDFDEDGRGDDLVDLENLCQKKVYYNLLVGKDNYFGIFVYFRHLTKAEQKDFTAQINMITSKFSQPFHIVGPVILNTHLDEISQLDSQKFFPIAIVVFAALLWWRIRSFAIVLVMFLAHSLSIGTVLGIMYLFSSKLNMLSITIPPLLLILGGASSIHLIHRIVFHCSQSEFKEAIKQAVGDIKYPCISSLVTTAIGFLSFMVSSMNVIFFFGVWMALGLIFCILTNLYTIPLLITYCYPFRPVITNKKKTFTTFSRKKSIISVLIITVITIFSLTFTISPHTESNVLLFLPENDSVRNDYEQVSRHLTGLFALEVMVEVENIRKIPWRWLEELTIAIENNPNVARCYGPITLLHNLYSEALEQDIDTLPEDANIDLAVISMHGILKDEWSRMVKDYGKKMRFTVLINTLDSKGINTIYQQIENMDIPKDIKIHITGIISLVQKAQENLIKTQLQSFSLAAILICLFLVTFIPDKKLALITIPVNIIPPIVTFGFMVMCDIEINAATVMIASIAMGIALDDSLHFCHFFLAQKSSIPVSEQINVTLENIYEPVITSSIANACGFLILCWANFVPLQYFGFFTAIAIGTALLCDLFLLPALITLYWRK